MYIFYLEYSKQNRIYVNENINYKIVQFQRSHLLLVNKLMYLPTLNFNNVKFSSLL